MEASYIKDLRSNYLVIPKGEYGNDEPGSVRMLQANIIPGILKPDVRIIDNKTFYYFNITSKQSIDIVYEKSLMNYEQVRTLLLDVTKALDQVYEYLLNENDLLLDPKYIFTDLSSGTNNICYLPGYSKDIIKQLESFIEYIMNKVDYKDNEAVLFIYNLYAICRKDGFSYDKLIAHIREYQYENPLKQHERKSNFTKGQIDLHIESNVKNLNRQIPVMMEKITYEEEKYFYPAKTYIYTGICSLGAVLFLFICIKFKIIYTSLGTRVDYSKLAVLLLMLFVVTGYLLRKIWDKKNRMTKMVGKTEYIDPLSYSNDTEEKNVLDIRSEQSKNISIDKYDKADFGYKKLFNKIGFAQSKHLPDKISPLQSKNLLNKYGMVHKKNQNDVCNITQCMNGNDSTILNEEKSYNIQLNKFDKLYKVKNSDNENETNEDINPTVLLNADAHFGCRLEPLEKDRYEIIRITDFPFVIGKQRGNVDYVLDKEVVSRFHVKILKEEDRFFIMDLNSTNGTYLNNRPLSCYQRYELQEGDEVAIAGIKYTFNKF